MTDKELEKLGFSHDTGNRWVRWCDGRSIEIRVFKGETFDSVWNSIYNAIYDTAFEYGQQQKSQAIKELLNIE